MLTRSPPPENILGIKVRPSTRARRMALRVEPRTGEVVLTWPPRTSARQAEKFVAENRDWIRRHSQNRTEPPAPENINGMTVHVAGQALTVEHRTGRGLSHICADTGKIILYGRAEFLCRRLRDTLVSHARALLTKLVHEKTALLGLTPRAVRIADPRARWGSCGPDGRLMLSWRLVLTPPDIMDYVVAHEVAHRRHMDHGPQFWRLCADLTAHKDTQKPRAWLRLHGDAVMRFLP